MLPLCKMCLWLLYTFYTSKTIEADGNGMKYFDINTRAVYGMKTVGCGHSALEALWVFKYAKTDDRDFPTKLQSPQKLLLKFV